MIPAEMQKEIRELREEVVNLKKHVNLIKGFIRHKYFRGLDYNWYPPKPDTTYFSKTLRDELQKQ